MPSVSGAQHRLMALCSTEEGRAKARGKCPPQDVALEFRHADRGRRFADSQRKAMKKIAAR